MQTVIYNQEMLDVAIEDIRAQFDIYKRLNLSYDKAKKEKTRAQIGFVFGGIISQVTDFFRFCGFNVDEEDVRYKLYEDVSTIVPELVVDKVLFGGKQRIKHIPEMDRALLSKFINGAFTVIDTNPLYAGVKLSPAVFYNWVFHLDKEEIRLAQAKTDLPQLDSDYLDYIRTLPCICCGVQHRSEAHHLKDNRLGGISQKSPDWAAMPLCHNCHLGVAHGTGFKEAMGWLPVPLDVFVRLCYLRWKTVGDRVFTLQNENGVL